MPTYNFRKHRYKSFFGVFEGKTWIKEKDDSSFCVRFNGKYRSYFNVLGHRKQFFYAMETKQKFSSVEEAESLLEKLTEGEIIRAMSKARKADYSNAHKLDPLFLVF